MQKVFISRDLKKNSPFKRQLAARKVEIIDCSLVEFSPIAIKDLATVDWLFFYSKNGVKYFLENAYFTKNNCLAILKQNCKWATIGRGTGKALEKYGIQPQFIGDGQPQPTAKAFLSLAKRQTVAFFRAKTSKKSIQKLLENKIKIVDYVVYENKKKTNFNLPFCDYLVFTSPLNTMAYFQENKWHPKQKIIAIGNTTATTLETLGFSNFIISKSPSEEELAAAVVSVFDS